MSASGMNRVCGMFVFLWIYVYGYMHHMLLISMLPACVYEPVGPRLFAQECFVCVWMCNARGVLHVFSTFELVFVCVKVQYVSISRGSKQFETCSLTLLNTKCRENNNDSLWMNANTSVSIWSLIELHPTMSAYWWLPFWWMSVNDWEALICVGRNKPCTSVIVSSLQPSLLVVCYMSQIFLDCDLRLWYLFPL